MEAVENTRVGSTTTTTNSDIWTERKFFRIYTTGDDYTSYKTVQTTRQLYIGLCVFMSAAFNSYAVPALNASYEEVVAHKMGHVEEDEEEQVEEPVQEDEFQDNFF